MLGKAEPNHHSRELGIVFFNRMVSLITRTKVSDCSNGYRAVRIDVLPQLVLRQEQFHTSEFLIEAIKRGIPAKEVPVTVASRLPRPLEEAGRGPLRARVRERDRPDLAAVASWVGEVDTQRSRGRMSTHDMHKVPLGEIRGISGTRRRAERRPGRGRFPYPAFCGPAAPGSRTSEGSGR